VGIVPPEKAEALEPQAYSGYQEYIRAQYRLWFEEDIPRERFNEHAWRVSLAEQLKEHLFFQNLLKILGGKVRSYDEIFNKLEKVTPSPCSLPRMRKYGLGRPEAPAGQRGHGRSSGLLCRVLWP